MLPVYTIGHSALSAMGNNSIQNFEYLMREEVAVRIFNDTGIAADPFCASRLQPSQMQMLAARYGREGQQLSPFEQMCLYVIEDALSEVEEGIPEDDCILILSSTKGNIEWLGVKDDDRLSLYRSAEIIGKYLKLKERPMVVSNACISGSLALLLAKRLLEQGRYKNAIVVGCDRLSRFVFSGFQAFHAISAEPCRPFDNERKGINLGEAAACMILSVHPDRGTTVPLACLKGGALSNDANHLSAPSRSGAELATAIKGAITEAGIPAGAIGMVSAHGTATVFNDEMEAKALYLTGMNRVPLHSLKSYIGHTLGAAGIIESIVACMAMERDVLPASLGYRSSGVSPADVQVTTQTTTGTYRNILKTASGFGGCNAALVWGKI